MTKEGTDQAETALKLHARVGAMGRQAKYVVEYGDGVRQMMTGIAEAAAKLSRLSEQIKSEETPTPNDGSDITGHAVVVNYGPGTFIGNPTTWEYLHSRAARNGQCEQYPPTTHAADAIGYAIGVDLMPQSPPVENYIDKSKSWMGYDNEIAKTAKRLGHPLLVVDLFVESLKHPSPARVAYLAQQGLDVCESRDQWVERKKAELCERLTREIKSTRREWPTHHGVPMVVDAHHHGGIFTVTVREQE